MTGVLGAADIRAGTPLPPWTRRTDVMNWNRYAAVNDEFIYIHMDDEAARSAGNGQGTFGMGNLRFAYLHNALHAAFGDDAVVTELECRYRSVNQKGDVLTVVGVVTDAQRADGDLVVRLDLDIHNADGASTCPGSAVVVLPGRSHA
ncbi:MaoC/PaaZ C-terminal domain-containing protein [Phytohabitans sp. ZYX-F-186]|uniref:MaoC/PaaZ C-terminal domain-containing protein n=1 Tax=Phytohabitans maris TaxID=3071409 RepID=A0ABU0ZES7_9ACTN|nr:MaoC/PaaZ C-terminal domain-containing protein [Phytohabitans sp. ZYX-F-186]MDQ7905547.1 MaoC/PaaZ C-terminal domain-containing protein [Phytohabitans sp. ZYX-F-186]